MRRVNIKAAFVGEPDANQEGDAGQPAGNDALELAVEGGTLTLIIPPNTADANAMSKATGVQAELKLEGGRSLTFYIYEDAENAGFEADETQRPEPTQPGQGAADDLSTAYEEGTVTTSS